jgi:hypothetical protein
MIKGFLVTACEKFQRPLTTALISIWESELADLPAENLPAVLERVSKASKFFPQPGHVREVFEQTSRGALSLKAEAEWQKLLDWIRLHYSPDLGIDRRAPQLDAATWHAAKAAGGIRNLESCPTAELPWRKKEFVAYYTTVHETGKAEYLLTDADAKRLLADIRSGGPVVPKKILKEDTRPVEFAPEPSNPAPVRKEFPPKSAGEQIAELRARGWIP